MLKATNKDFASSKKILEVNPSHPLIRNLAEQKEKGSASEAQLNEWIDTLYDTALVAEGSPIKDPANFARRITQIMQQASGR